jgi:hypothetical protein
VELTEYPFPRYFPGDPDVPPTDHKVVLGMTGVINMSA